MCLFMIEQYYVDLIITVRGLIPEFFLGKYLNLGLMEMLIFNYE